MADQLLPIANARAAPKRLGSRTRCYSQRQIIKLNHIRYLIKEKGVNIKGVKVIIEMEYREGPADE